MNNKNDIERLGKILNILTDIVGTVPMTLEAKLSMAIEELIDYVNILSTEDAEQNRKNNQIDITEDRK